MFSSKEIQFSALKRNSEKHGCLNNCFDFRKITISHFTLSTQGKLFNQGVSMSQKKVEQYMESQFVH